MTITVEKAALLMTIQDLGRFGSQRYGMPQSGPMDWCAFYGANLLVGNEPNAASIEIGFSSTVIFVEVSTLMAVCGAGFRLYVNDREMPLWMAVWVNQGDRLQIEQVGGGNWVYLAVAGGILSKMWLGSRSVYPRAGLGRLIQDGDRLPVGVPTGVPTDAARLLAGHSIPFNARPVYQRDPVVRAIPGPHQDRFQPSSLALFWEQPFFVSPQSDRMGYRLSGPQLSHTQGADLISQGMVMGEIQVPVDGKPIVMMADRPTTGGYTSIATVARVDLPLFAQAQPGLSELRFTPIDVSAAQSSLAVFVDQLEAGVEIEEETWKKL